MTPRNGRVVRLFWSGGTKSTLRLCELLLHQHAIVYPVYFKLLGDSAKLNYIHRFKRQFCKKYPSAGKRFKAPQIIVDSVDFAKYANKIRKPIEMCKSNSSVTKDKSTFLKYPYASRSTASLRNKSKKFRLLNQTNPVQSKNKSGKTNMLKTDQSSNLLINSLGPIFDATQNATQNATRNVNLGNLTCTDNKTSNLNAPYNYFYAPRFKKFKDQTLVLKTVLEQDIRFHQVKRLFGGDKALYSNDPSKSRLSTLIEGYGKLSNKVRFAKLMWDFHEIYVPRTFIISNRKFVGDAPNQRDIDAYSPRKSHGYGVWFMKPAHQYGGQGIRVAHDPRDFLKYARTGWSYSVQPHVPDIALIDERKFDVRIYVLFVFDIGKPVQAYLFNEGMIKMCSSPFKVGSLDLSNNLTNKTFQSSNVEQDCVDPNTTAPAYNPESCTRLFTEWEHYETANRNMRRALQKMNVVWKKHLHIARRKQGFWLSGLDLMFDTKLRPWLLEVNGNPGMNPEWNTNERWDAFFIEAMKGVVELGIARNSVDSVNGWIKI